MLILLCVGFLSGQKYDLIFVNVLYVSEKNILKLHQVPQSIYVNEVKFINRVQIIYTLTD